jgi:hypothetical protein
LLAAGILIAHVRTAQIFYERRQDNATPQKQEARFEGGLLRHSQNFTLTI